MSKAKRANKVDGAAWRHAETDQMSVISVIAQTALL